MLKVLKIPLGGKKLDFNFILTSVSQIYLSIILKVCILPIFLRNLSFIEIRNAAYLKSSICSLPAFVVRNGFLYSMAEFSKF